MKCALLLCMLLVGAQAALAQPHTGTPAPDAERTLRVASELDFPPLALVKPDGSADGFSVDLFKAVAGVMALKYHIYTGPWNSLKNDVIAGKADLLINMAINPARAVDHDFTVSHTITQAAIFVRKGSATLRAVEDLRGKSLLVVAGDHVQQWAAAQPWATHLVPVATVGEAMELLARGKHDGVLVARIVGLLTLQGARLDGLVALALPLPGAEQKFAFAVKKGDAALLAQLNEGLAIVRADGTYSQIYDKWFNPIEPRGLPLREVALYVLPVLALLLALMAVLAYLLRVSQVALRAERVGLEAAVAARTEALRHTSQLLNSIIETMPAMLVLKRADDLRFEMFNRAGEQLLGYSRHDLLGKTDFDFFPSEQADFFVSEDRKVLATTEMTEIAEEPITTASGETRTLLTRKIALRDGGGAATHLLVISVDISTRSRAEAALKALHLLHSNILNSIGEGVQVLDPDGKTLFTNPAAAALLGWDAEALIGQPSHLLIHHTRADGSPYPRIECHIYATLQDGQGRSVDDEVFWRKDGSSFPVAYVTRPMQDAAGGIVGAVLAFRDVTEARKAQAVVAQALRTQSNFLANITHELRTPLNAVLGFAELLKDQVAGPLNPKQVAFAADIIASGEHLLALVNGILEMSRLAAGGIALNCVPVKIGAVLEERVAAGREAAAARRLSIAVDVAADADHAELDPTALRRMFDALLDNAIKFNRDGGSVVVSARRAGDRLDIAVADTGIGIAYADLTRLFVPLVQLDTGLARHYGGIGMGLALARSLAELHGGTLDVESQAGKGSTFSLRLPITIAARSLN